MNSVEALRVWTETVKNFIQKIRDVKGNFLYLVIRLNDLLVVFTKILVIQLSSEMQIKECIISTCGLNTLDDVLNEIKIKALKCLNLLAGYVFEMRDFDPYFFTKYYELLGKLLPIMLSSLIKFCKTEKLDPSKSLTVKLTFC